MALVRTILCVIIVSLVCNKMNISGTLVVGTLAVCCLGYFFVTDMETGEAKERNNVDILLEKKKNNIITYVSIWGFLFIDWPFSDDFLWIHDQKISCFIYYLRLLLLWKFCWRSSSFAIVLLKASPALTYFFSLYFF